MVMRIDKKKGRRLLAFDLRFLWWAQQDSNLQSRDYEVALESVTTQSTCGFMVSFGTEKANKGP